MLSAGLPRDYEKTGSLGAQFIWFWGHLGTEAPEVCDEESGRRKIGQAFVPPVTFSSRLPIEEAAEQKAVAASLRRPTRLKGSSELLARYLKLLMGTTKGNERPLKTVSISNSQCSRSMEDSWMPSSDSVGFSGNHCHKLTVTGKADKGPDID